MLTITTPAFAAKSNDERGDAPEIVESKNTKSKNDKGKPPSYVTSSKQGDDADLTNFGGTPVSNSSQGSGPVSTGPAYQQGPASGGTIGTTVPGIPAGSVVPSGMFGPGYQRGSEPVVNGGMTVATNQPAPGPLFQGPVPGAVATTSTGPASRLGSGLIVDAMDSRSQTQARPDVRVIYVDSASNSTSTLFHFRVENVSSQPSTAISLSSVVREQSDANTASRRVEEQHAQIASLAAGQAQDVVVTCTPRPGFRCVSGALDASVANDVSPTNNSAHS